MRLPPQSTTASFDVDAQQTFSPLCPSELPVPGGDEIVGALNAQAELASARLGSKDAHSPKAIWVTDDPSKIGAPGVAGDNVEEHWPVHAVPGTAGFELLPDLPRPVDYDFFVWKGVELDMHPYGACYHDIAETMSTGVIEWLRAREITDVLVGGLATDYCVKATALQLAKAGFTTHLNLAACRGISAETTREAIEQMRATGVQILDDLSSLKPKSEPAA